MPLPREPHFEQSGPARDAQSRAGPPGARALFDGDGNFVCWQPPRAMHGAAPFEPAAPPWRAYDYGGAEIFASP